MDFKALNAWFRCANYIAAAQIYLLDNPLLLEPLKPEHIKPRLLGHWGTCPGLNFIYLHLSQAIIKHNLNMIQITGPGHGAPALIANAYIEGTYTEYYPDITLKKLFRQFSFPGGIPSHAAPETPGSIHEGGELGYSLAHAFGAVLDNPDLIAACVIGDGEAETGPLAASWHSNKFLNPVHNGAVLPILHLNGYKIANPTILSRISHEELKMLLTGYGYHPYFVEGDDPMAMHEIMQETLDKVISEIKEIKKKRMRPFWPMIVLKTPKGWTGPKSFRDKKIERSFRAHQVPLTDVRSNPEQLKLLEEWLKSYKPQELFNPDGTVVKSITDLAPKGKSRMSDNPHANGGLLLKDLQLPDFRNYAVDVKKEASSAHTLGLFLRDVMQPNFRLMAPDETASNKLDKLFEVTDRDFVAEIYPDDDHLSMDGRVMEVLSEHLCQGWLEGYLLTGRHGFFSSYEAFIHIVDSMFNQWAKWLEMAEQVPWRKPIASLNYFLTSHVWRQDHNGFSHQDPGFIDLVMNKKPVRVYLPPDANTLLCVADHCLRSRNYVNVIVAGKQPALQYFTMQEAIEHCKKGIGWIPSGSDEGEPDAILACCGDIPTMETLGAANILRKIYPEIKLKVVNVVDLMVLKTDHPHSLSDQDFITYFTKDKPVIFAFHGYPTLIHRLTYNRPNHDNFHVHGFKEEGTTTTPFDMCVLNKIDRYHLAMNAIKRIGTFASIEAEMELKLQEHYNYIREVGDDLPEVKNCI